LDLPPLRKAAILIVSLEDSLARKVLPQLDRGDVDAVSLEIGRLEGIDPAEQRAVLEEFSALMMKRLRFVFEDMLRMDERSLRGAYHEEDERTWALALAGAPRPLRMKVLAALESEHEAGLRRALGELGPFRLDDVEAAQAEVAERLRRLHDLGRISLPEPDGQEEILV
jgi:flagellar motor switch protein FliG